MLDLPAVGSVYEHRLVTDLGRPALVQYAGASGDFNPLHTDEPYATGVAGYPSVFAHGMLTMGLMGTLLTRLFGDGALRSFTGRFAAQVWPGDSLDAVVTVVGHEQHDGLPLIVLELLAVRQDGTTVYTGTARTRLTANAFSTPT
jgi:peroxisomal enoyl-CoA hydratase 2